MTSGIYQIRNSVNGHRYIGSSRNIKNRFKSHKSSLRLNKGSNAYLQHAWNKYGENSFEFSVVGTCPENKLLVLEQYMLTDLDPEYNIQSIAGKPPDYTGKTHTEEARRKISRAMMGNKRGLGNRHTEQVKEKLSLLRRGEGTSPRLTELDVIEIRRLYATGKLSQSLLGKMFKLTQQGIWHIVNRTTWKQT